MTRRTRSDRSRLVPEDKKGNEERNVWRTKYGRQFGPRYTRRLETINPVDDETRCHKRLVGRGRSRRSPADLRADTGAIGMMRIAVLVRRRVGLFVIVVRVDQPVGMMVIASRSEPPRAGRIRPCRPTRRLRMCRTAEVRAPANRSPKSAVCESLRSGHYHYPLDRVN